MILHNILRYVVLAGAFLAPFVVFIIFNDLFFPFITSKNFAFRALVEIMFAAWLVLAYMSPAYRPKLSPILWTLGVFVAIVFLADMFGVNPYKSFWSNYERMEGFVGLLHFFMYFLAASAVLTSEKLWERWFQTTVLASVLMAVYGTLQLLGTFDISQSETRIDGRFGNSAYMAVYLLVHIFLAAFLFARAKGNAILRYIYCLAILLEVVMLFYTQTRGSIVGLFVGAFLTMLLVAVFEKSSSARAVRKIALGGVVLTVLLVGGFFAMKDSAVVQNSAPLKRLADISLIETTTKSRFMVWDMALQGFKERPILGWGQENFNFVFNKYYNPGMYAQEQWFDRAHNIFFDWLVAGGLLGLLAYLALFVVLLYYIWHSGIQAGNVSFFGRIRHWFAHLGHIGDGGFTVAEKSILTGLLAAYFIHNFFVFDNLGSYIFFFSFLAYFHHRALADQGGGVAAGRNSMREPLPALLAVIVLLAAAAYFVNVRPYLANATLIKGLQPHEEGLSKNLEFLKDAIAYNTFGTSEAREQLVQTAIRVKELNAPPETTQQFFDLAKQEILLQNERFPGDARYESFAAILLSRFNMGDEAIAHLKIAREQSPKKQTILFDLASAYLSKKDAASALAAAKEAYELEPSFKEAARIYAIVAVHAGDNKLAEEILMQNFSTIVVDDDNLVNAYGATGQFGKAVAILELRVKNNPNSPDAHLRLAAGYSELGQNAKAIAEIRKVIEMEPQFKEQGEFYIKQIQAGKKP